MKKQLPLLCLLALIGAFVFSLEGCGDNDICMKNEPVNAKFKIGQKLSAPFATDSTFEVDTIFGSAGGGSDIVYFEANEKDASYLWKVGNDPRSFASKSFQLGGFPLGKTEVTLIVSKAPNKSCFPNDNGMDTIIKKIYVVDVDHFKAAFEGTFQGSMNINPKDTFSINIRNYGWVVPRPDPCYPFTHLGTQIFNYPKGCNLKVDPCEGGYRLNYLYKYFYLNDTYEYPNCTPRNAFGKIYQYNKIILINLRPDYTTKTVVPNGDVFTGTKKK